MLFAINEILNIIIVSTLVSFIFSRAIIENFLIEGLKKHIKTLLLVFPFVLLHEIAHKIAGISVGLEVSFAPAYVLLVLGILMRQANIGFVFFTNSYLVFQPTSYSTSALIGLAGPMVNLLFLSIFLLIQKMKIKPQFSTIISEAIKINLFLFIFSILPLPGFDGAYVLNISYF